MDSKGLLTLAEGGSHSAICRTHPSLIQTTVPLLPRRIFKNAEQPQTSDTDVEMSKECPMSQSVKIDIDMENTQFMPWHSAPVRSGHFH
jgi:hypothetical protein